MFPMKIEKPEGTSTRRACCSRGIPGIRSVHAHDAADGVSLDVKLAIIVTGL
jgi:hypothetical protein